MGASAKTRLARHHQARCRMCGRILATSSLASRNQLPAQSPPSLPLLVDDMLTWALQTLPEDLWARSGMCQAESAVMLAATSKQVRGLLGGMQRRLPAAVKVRKGVMMESVAGGLPRLLAWCSVVRLDASGLRMGAGGVRMLAGVLGQ